ncbi:hypothetical protein F8M41_019828 [Gigaspora margarita]|uniref:Integrase catalytic domain-containing protein n=1 Tax=Gigaspora margarita TaxID=4874 RepID=A0A8H4AJE9_GIGMA|nr:hypothetical protein F8M41_019828 [Gigaspora margarita]
MRVVLTYDFELREALFEKFHIGDAHFKYHKTYAMIYERHIGIKKYEVENYALTLIDVFSYYIWVIPLKDKEGSTIHSELTSSKPREVERFNQTLGRHLTKMIWDEVSGVQGYRWIDVLSQFVIGYNKAPHEIHKKLPYKAFFGFKMHAVYNTPENITPEDIALEDIALDNVAMEDYGGYYARENYTSNNTR